MHNSDKVCSLMRVGVLTLGVLVLLMSSVAVGQSYSVTKYSDLAYGTVPGYQTLDVYKPQGVSNAPVLFFVHGGAWTSGDKSEYNALGNTFAGYYGIVTVVINYRLSPQYKHPAHVQDAAKAFHWVYDNISGYGGDDERIILFGHSSGGHTVSLLATNASYLSAEGRSTSDIAGTISFSGAYNVGNLPAWWAGIKLQVFGTLRYSQLWNASPPKYLDSWQPDFLIVYTPDELAGLDSQATTFHSDVLSHGTASQLNLLPGYTHYTEIERINPAEWGVGPALLVAGFIQNH